MVREIALSGFALLAMTLFDFFRHENIRLASPVCVGHHAGDDVSHFLVKLIRVVFVVAYIPYLFPQIFVEIDVCQ